RGGYDRMLRYVLRHRRATLAVTVATIVLSGYLYAIVPKGLFPQQDTGFLSGIARASQNVSFGSMRELEEKVNAIVLADPDLESAVSFIGAANGWAGNQGTVFVGLRPDRRTTADQVIARLRPALASIPGITLFLQ